MSVLARDEKGSASKNEALSKNNCPVIRGKIGRFVGRKSELAAVAF
jgi:hypothetical protein